MKKIVKDMNNTEVVDALNKIILALYLVVALLFVNVVVDILNTKNTRIFREAFGTTDTSGNETPDYEYDVSKFSEVDYAGLKDIMKSDGTHVIYMGRETCSYCAMFIPVMQQAQDEYNFKTYYFDVTRVFDYSKNSVVDQTAYDELIGYNDFFKENFLATPMIVVFKDGKYVNGTMGYQEFETYASFLEQSGISKK